MQVVSENRIDYDYRASGGKDDMLSRVDAILDGSGVLASCKYFGLGAVVRFDYEFYLWSAPSRRGGVWACAVGWRGWPAC